MLVRRSQERGHARHGWLDSYHTFSFANYYDPAQMGFRALRVINEDRVAPAQGFPPHSHRDMEILTYVLAGSLQHKDSLGNGAIVTPGEVQRMTAGTGVTHSEYNASTTDPVHLLQIWVLPAAQGLKPSYEQQAFPLAEKQGQLRLVASQEGRAGSVTIHQDLDLYVTVLALGETVTHPQRPNRHRWVHIARGTVNVNGQSLQAGDAAQISDEVVLEGIDAAEVLIFDLA
ncbi:pirin family protein [Candidatus Cyanaurora vandensis]|uniref:pirin family protein n=1 Tax=Candidatus Cyanaurora vandensis TaxID=2714958 RepID=UPI002580A56F|nr:pirin family protein [Candidatus Cyanaurora vandensis]